jgi:hypothetical protein
MTISQGCDAVGPAALAARVGLFRSAVLAGASQAAAPLRGADEQHNALARHLLDRQDDCLRFTRTGGARLITTAANAASA